MKSKTVFASSCLAVLCFIAATAVSFSQQVPILSGRVNDDAGILSLETVRNLETLLKAHEDSTSNQVVVLTVRSLEGESIEQFSIKVVEEWKLGQKGRDNGVLLLVSASDRKVRIEVGRGLEGDLPDITCGSIIRREILPEFKSGDYDAGVTAGVQGILAAIGGSYVADEEHAAGPGEMGGLVVAVLLFVVVVGLFTVIGVLSKGCMSWFLYVFLLPFWGAFPVAFFGEMPGLSMLGIYAVAFPLMKLWLAKSQTGSSFYKKIAATGFLVPATGVGSSSGRGGWSSSSSGGGSSFSGGGGSFSGGGASGSW